MAITALTDVVALMSAHGAIRLLGKALSSNGETDTVSTPPEETY
jgi:hypothetical protein